MLEPSLRIMSEISCIQTEKSCCKKKICSRQKANAEPEWQVKNGHDGDGIKSKWKRRICQKSRRHE